MKYLPCFLLLFLFLGSCQEIDEMEKPKDLIAKEKMVEVLTELAILHGARSYNKRFLEETGMSPETYLFNKYDIDSVQFVKSSDYYAENYAVYKTIYDSVKSRLEDLQVKYEALKVEQEKIKDSIRELKKKTGDTLINLQKRVPLKEDTIIDKRILSEPISSEDTTFPTPS